MKSPGQQFAKLLPLMAGVYVPLLQGLIVIVVVFRRVEIPPRTFFIDPVAYFNAPMYIGFLSNFGVLLWGAAAAVCLFGGWLLWRSTEQRELPLFLICAGAISALLMFDDLYLLHEEVFPERVGIPQKLVFVIYGLLVLVFLFRFRVRILETDFVLLLLAFGFFAGSVFVDVFIAPEEFTVFGSLPGRHLIEDGLKLFGIATWCAYLVRTTAQTVRPFVGETSG